MTNNIKDLLTLIQENPDLPVVPMVDQEIVADECYTWWLGKWGRCKKTKYYSGRNYIHFYDDDELTAYAEGLGKPCLQPVCIEDYGIHYPTFYDTIWNIGRAPEEDDESN